MLPDRRYFYKKSAEAPSWIQDVDPIDVNEYIEKRYLHRTSGHHH